tara:strand:+ start:771 stop:1763 length:993 start_codon:yes stop_codon:yes gene_type:complete
MQNLKSSNAKRRKLLYYLYYTPLVYFFPSIISRLRLKNILNNSFQKEYIQSRVRYYFKKTSNFKVSKKGKNLSELFWNQFFKNKQNSHFIDFYMLLQFFNKKNKVDFIYSTKDNIDSFVAKKNPPYPTFVKSRPIGSNNQNSILLKLNRVKLFHFIKDPKKFENKKNQAVWRGDIRNNPHREYFVKNFYRTPFFDIGQTSPKQDVAWRKSFMSIKDQLDFKFIFCLEGKCISTNLYWAMSSNSVCIMPQPKYESWFMEGKLKDGVHYIKVKDDFSDAEKKIEFYNNNNDKCLEIIDNANKFVEQFKNSKQERLIQLLILKQYFQFTGQNE